MVIKACFYQIQICPPNYSWPLSPYNSQLCLAQSDHFMKHLPVSTNQIRFSIFHLHLVSFDLRLAGVDSNPFPCVGFA